MAQRIRTLFFWLHLTAGLLAGVVVLIMSATGVLLTFEKQLIHYADTRAISLTPPPSATPLPIDTLLAASGPPDWSVSRASSRCGGIPRLRSR